MTDRLRAILDNDSAATDSRKRWLWLPSLSFGDGLSLSVILLFTVMLHRFGLGKVFTVLYVSLLCIPFVARPLTEAVVSYFRGTTKVWVLSAEFISALSLCALAFILSTSYWLQGTLCFLAFFVLAGVFANVAVERFYMDDSCGNGVRDCRLFTLFRSIAMLFGVGVCVTLAGNMEVVTRDIRYSWSFVAYILAGVELLLWLWHTLFLPGGRRFPAKEKDVRGLALYGLRHSLKVLLHEQRHTLTLVFIAVFVLPEAFLALMSPVFMVDAAHNGGLGQSPQEFGLAFGTVGVSAFFVGKAYGMSLARRLRLRWSAVIAATVMPVHGLSMCFLSYSLDASLLTACLVSFVGCAASGFAMHTVSVIVRCYSASGFSVLRRAVALGVVSLTVVCSSSLAGFMQAELGYRQFFSVVLFLYAVPFMASVALLLRKR